MSIFEGYGAFKVLTLNEQLGSSILIGWKLEVGMASWVIQHDKGVQIFLVLYLHLWLHVFSQ